MIMLDYIVVFIIIIIIITTIIIIVKNTHKRITNDCILMVA